jgi:hypothetical protein
LSEALVLSPFLGKRKGHEGVIATAILIIWPEDGEKDNFRNIEHSFYPDKIYLTNKSYAPPLHPLLQFRKLRTYICVHTHTHTHTHTYIETRLRAGRSGF